MKRTLALALLLAGCASYRPVVDTPVKIGRPYAVRGITYTPADDPTYDMLGLASWYGSESGNRTASGEKFRAKWITAAHPTLPLPTYVEVTSLDTGRRLIVRVNDRGPFVGKGRIIDLSRGAAQELGVRASGLALVRIRIVAPSEHDRDRLRHGKPARALPPVSETVRINLRGQLRTAGY